MKLFKPAPTCEDGKRCFEPQPVALAFPPVENGEPPFPTLRILRWQLLKWELPKMTWTYALEDV
jgi:hypothetical protein